MYTPRQEELLKFDIRNIGPFVEFWSQFANTKVFEQGGKTQIDYIAELNLGADLTEGNVRKLVRWKDPLRLTHTILTDPENARSNPKVDRILQNIGSLNDFRRGVLTEAEIKAVVDEIFPGGFVYKIFLLHIAKPHLYPIADQHVFRSYSVHKKVTAEITWETYEGYREYFSKLACELGVEEVSENVEQLKKIDNALMAFGQFLNKYNS